MRNPWTKKNPLMSMWLSAANKVVGSARGQATAAVKREAAKAASAATAVGITQAVDFWADALASPAATPPAATPRKRRKAR